MRTHVLLLACIAAAFSVSAQKPVRVVVHHKLGDLPFALNQPAENNEGDDFIVTRLQYFMSEFTITHDGGQTTRLEDAYALVNAAEETALDLGTLDVTQVERLDFGIGVPSPENNADPALWPAGHPLAPTAPSMHWGWAGGYRFVAMEGEAGPTFTTNYQFHPLGNENYHFARILVSAQEIQDTLVIELNADYTQALYDIDVESGPISHGNLWLAPVILENFRNRVFTATNAPTAVDDESLRQALSVFPNPTSGRVTVRLNDTTTGIVRAEVLDATGRIIEAKAFQPRMDVDLQLPVAGLYRIRLTDGQGRIAYAPVLVH